LGLPVKFEGTDGAELGQDGPEDLEVQDVTKVDPDTDERAEVGRNDDRVEIVEGFGSLRPPC
jgi:hypothetical protein